MIDAKVEEFFRVVNWIEFIMFKTVLVTSCVSDPDIISSIGCDKGRRLVRIIDYPSVGRVRNAMLE